MSKILLLPILLSCQEIDLSSAITEEGQPEETAELNAATSDPGKINRRLMLRSFRSLNATMSSLTGVEQQFKSVSTYGKVIHMLASDNKIESFSPTMQVGVFRLATSYCQGLKNNLKKDSNSLNAFGLTNINEVSDPKQLAGKLIDKFWQSNLTVRADKDSAVNELVTLANKITDKKNTFVVMCTATLASASVTFH